VTFDIEAPMDPKSLRLKENNFEKDVFIKKMT